MTFLHRKLIEPPIVPNTTEILCNEFCTNFQRPCPPICFPCFLEICNLNPISNKAPKSHKPSTFLIVSLCLLVAAFLFVCCYVFYRKYYSPRIRRPFLDPQVEEENRDGDDEGDGDSDRVRFHGHEFDYHDQVAFHPIWYINTIGLQPSIINSITICKYKKGEGLIEGTDCSVCLSEFEEDETLRLLPKCSHAFHLPCIDTWLRSHTNCPLCRAPIVVTSNQQPDEETQVMILENGNSEFGEQRENDEVPELRIRIEEEEEEELQQEVERVNQEVVRRIEPSRRSVSLDSLSASKINASLSRFLERVSDGSSSKIQSSEVNKSKKLQRHRGNSSSKGRSNRNIEPVSMKRSLSSEGICRQIQRHDSNRPLRSF